MNNRIEQSLCNPGNLSLTSIIEVRFKGEGIHYMNTGDYPKHLLSSMIEDPGGDASLDFIYNA